MTHRGAKRNSCPQVAPICAKVWRVDSDAILVRILTSEIFLRTYVLYPGKWLAVSLYFAVSLSAKNTFYRESCVELFSFL